MGVLIMKEVKKIVREHGKQASKDFLNTLDSSIRRRIYALVERSRSKRLSEADVLYGLGKN